MGARRLAAPHSASWILPFLHVLGIYYISYLMGVRAAQQKRSGKERRGEESPPRRHRHTGRGKGRDFVMYRELSLHPTEALGRPKRNTSAQTDCRYRAAYTHIRPVVGWESVGVEPVESGKEREAGLQRPLLSKVGSWPF